MKPQQITFANAYLLHGDKFKAYKEAYPGIADGDSLRVAANRLLRHPQVQAYIHNIEAPAREAAMDNIKASAATRIEQQHCTVEQKRSILAQMILGGFKVKRHLKLKDSIIEVEDDLSPYALLRAIELDCKIESGKYKAATLAIPVVQEIQPTPPIIPKHEPVGYENIPLDDPRWKGVTYIPSLAQRERTGIVSITDGIPKYENNAIKQQPHQTFPPTEGFKNTSPLERGQGCVINEVPPPAEYPQNTSPLQRGQGCVHVTPETKRNNPPDETSPPDNWHRFLHSDRNTRALCPQDRKQKEIWFKALPEKQQLKLIALYTVKDTILLSIDKTGIT